MPPTQYRTIKLDAGTYGRLQKMAWLAHRTIEMQLAWLMDAVESGKHYETVSVSMLPHPLDAEPVPLICVAPVEEAIS
jgi:hypothetical protein